jgi:hypothetical protein
MASRCWVNLLSFLRLLTAVPTRRARTAAELSAWFGTNMPGDVTVMKSSSGLLHLTQRAVARLNWMSPQRGQRGTSNEGCGCMEDSGVWTDSGAPGRERQMLAPLSGSGRERQSCTGAPLAMEGRQGGLSCVDVIAGARRHWVSVT